jgi:two-component system LytT family response regulator
MKVLIVEDEKLAVDGLKIQLQKFDPSIEVLADFDTIEDTVSFLKGGPPVDLAFFDIQLADGLSFEIFEQVDISFPIIFTTAYDEYALKAFEVNSIDYLLKPIGQEGLGRAFGKLESRRVKEAPIQLDIEALRQALLGESKSFKERFMVKVGSKLASYPTQDILYFFGENKIVWLVNKDGRKYPVDYKLEDLQDMLNPKDFYRLNRTYIASHDAIKQVTTYSNSRLKVSLQSCSHDDIFVSRDKAESFRLWLGK